jgi:citrate lyase subunit beta/citryl-CoA lyase
MNATLSKVEEVGIALTPLFVPGDRPERFHKAFNSGTDLVIIDLEDAVSEENKEAALTNTVEVLSSPNSDIRAVVRINKERISYELPALLSIASLKTSGLIGVMIPKVESALDIPADLGTLPIIALVESALGIENIASIARADGVIRIAFGAVDFAAEMESQHSDLIAYAKTQILISTRAAGLYPALDTPSVEISDLEKVSAEARNAYELGFGGKMCIHPAQISSIKQGFAPTVDEIAWAQKIVSVDSGAHQIDGKMVDLPVVARAQRILARANPQ